MIFAYDIMRLTAKLFRLISKMSRSSWPDYPTYPSNTSSIIISRKPIAKPIVPILEWRPS